MASVFRLEPERALTSPVDGEEASPQLIPSTPDEGSYRLDRCHFDRAQTQAAARVQRAHLSTAYPRRTAAESAIGERPQPLCCSQAAWTGDQFYSGRSVQNVRSSCACPAAGDQWRSCGIRSRLVWDTRRPSATPARPRDAWAQQADRRRSSAHLPLASRALTHRATFPPTHGDLGTEGRRTSQGH